MGPGRRTIHQTFETLHQQKRIGLIPFIPAGYPDLQTTGPALRALDEAGASIIEVGFPFSDPIADGPTIQAAFTAALSHGLKVTDIFATIRAARSHIASPLVAMVSYSLVFRYGLHKFLADARLAGFDGLILPDLPPPEAQEICNHVRAAGLETILLVAPTTAPDRRKEIARLSSGFVYYLAVSGITGVRDQLPPDLTENVQQLRQLTDRPICVGFGISKPQHMTDLSGIADGAIVGSAIVKRMTEHQSAGPAAIAKSIGDFCKELQQNKKTD